MKKLAMAFAGAILVSGIVALNLWRALHTERAQFAALQARVAELETAAQQANAARSAAPATAPAVANSPAAATQPAAPATPATASGKAATESVRSSVAGVSAMMASPEFQGQMRNQVRSELERQFPDLAQELGLTPAEAEKFFDLLAKQAGATMGDTLGMLSGGNGAGTQEIQVRMMEQQQASEAELQAMLGGRYPKWELYQGTIAARQQVTQLRAMLGSGDNALDEAHAKPLVAALGAETARINQGMRETMRTTTSGSQNVLEEQLRYSAAQNDRLISVASPHLTGPQLDSYKRMLEQQEKLTRMMLGTMSGQGATRGQGGAPR
jgi:hypothetical protein